MCALFLLVGIRDASLYPDPILYVKSMMVWITVSPPISLKDIGFMLLSLGLSQKSVSSVKLHFPRVLNLTSFEF